MRHAEALAGEQRDLWLGVDIRRACAYENSELACGIPAGAVGTEDHAPDSRKRFGSDAAGVFSRGLLLFLAAQAGDQRAQRRR